MLQACILDWGDSWEKYVPSVEFAYNKNFQDSIGMSPYEALYGRPRRTPLCRILVGEGNLRAENSIED